MPGISPVPDELSAPFWAAAARNELAIQRCRGCRRYQQPPTFLCVDCGDTDVAFERVSGRGRVHSFTVVHDARYRAFREIQPYVIAAVELEEQPLLLLLSNLPGADPARIRIGMPVEVAFERVGEDAVIPQFRPSAELPQ